MLNHSGLTFILFVCRPFSFTAKCNARASHFAAPKHLEEKKEEKKVRVATAVLSTTARAKARNAKKENGDDAKMEEAKAEKEAEEAKEKEAEEAKEKADADAAKAPKKKEALTHTLSNPSRMTQGQAQHVVVELDQRYRPVHQGAASGIIMLIDTTPSEEEEVTAVKVPSANQDEDDEEDAEPPAAFEWTPPAAASN
jgi:26S proteasome regulatory subunit N2